MLSLVSTRGSNKLLKIDKNLTTIKIKGWSSPLQTATLSLPQIQLFRHDRFKFSLQQATRNFSFWSQLSGREKNLNMLLQRACGALREMPFEKNDLPKHDWSHPRNGISNSCDGITKWFHWLLHHITWKALFLLALNYEKFPIFSPVNFVPSVRLSALQQHSILLMYCLYTWEKNIIFRQLCRASSEIGWAQCRLPFVLLIRLPTVSCVAFLEGSWEAQTYFLFGRFIACINTYLHAKFENSLSWGSV